MEDKHWSHHWCCPNSCTYQHIVVRERSTFSALLQDRLTLAPPLSDIPYYRKKTKCLQHQSCSHFSCQTGACQGPHMAPVCILQEETNTYIYWLHARHHSTVTFKPVGLIKHHLIFKPCYSLLLKCRTGWCTLYRKCSRFILFVSVPWVPLENHES